jgi:CheY-like chemotaxis protein
MKSTASSTRGATPDRVMHPVNQEPSHNGPACSMNKKRIMLVDDEEAFTTFLKMSLPGFEVCVENNPLQAIETARRFRPDLIFLDIVMPGADGGTIAAQFNEDSELRRIPIVFLTAIISEKEAASRQPACGYEFLAKPVTREQILVCIDKHLGTKSSG